MLRLLANPGRVEMPPPPTTDVRFVPSQSGAFPITDAVPYTSSPMGLAFYDLFLVIKKASCIPGIVWPLTPWGSGYLDELYPSMANIFDIFFHTVLIITQTIFLLSLPLFLIIPTGFLIPYVATFLLINFVVCKLLNGNQRIFHSNYPVVPSPEHKKEHWVFVNGVAVGRNWLQNNIDRIALTFGRRVTGIHNPTSGIIFDLIECIVQRDLCYATRDIRNIHAELKRSLLMNEYKKVVLILHSQGGIEGGLVLDWLLAELPRDIMHKLEIYTFGNAANHFNNPHKSLDSMLQANDPSKPGKAGSKAVRYIEHYANSGDFVSQWGVLNFIKIRNRYMGRIFERPGSGHQLNQHYLDNMFPLDPNGRGVLEVNDFMDREIELEEYDLSSDMRQDLHTSKVETTGIESNPPLGLDDGMSILSQTMSAPGRRYKVKDLSRLWQYRNGRSPPPEKKNAKQWMDSGDGSVKSTGADVDVFNNI